jgi:hypothetical protein
MGMSRGIQIDSVSLSSKWLLGAASKTTCRRLLDNLDSGAVLHTMLMVRMTHSIDAISDDHHGFDAFILLVI